MEKKIEILKMKVKDLKTDFGNPRKIKRKDLNELKQSLIENGDFGVFLLDENNNIVGGNQRRLALMEIDPETEVLCKKFYGYSVNELRAINIKDNLHSGTWDNDMLADWTAGFNLAFNTSDKNDMMLDRRTKDMELIHYEKYDYVMIVCRYETDYLDLVRRLGIEDKKVPITDKRKIKARAIWYDECKAQIIPYDEVE